VTAYQLKQKEVIEKIEEKLKSNTIDFTTVSPVDDWDTDNRICLTGVHILDGFIRSQITDKIIKPLWTIAPDHHYYTGDTMHATIKNVRVIADPPRFSNEDIQNAKEIFARVVPMHKTFQAFFYRLIIFPGSLNLVGTTEEELNNLVLDLDQNLKAKNIMDDKIYSDPKTFFTNVTLTRFTKAPADDFKIKVGELNKTISFDNYVFDSVTLLTCNAIFEKRNIIGSWALK
jgi:hypothetical protein